MTYCCRTELGLAPAVRGAHVALVVETSLAPGREILQGVARYVRQHQRESAWTTFVEPRGLADVVPEWLAGWTGDGIIARVQDRRIADAVRAVGVPVVDVLGAVGDAEWPVVQADDEGIAQMAAEHLIERGVRNFAYVGLAGERWARRRGDAFARAVRSRARWWEQRQVTRQEICGTGAVGEIADWIADMPKPVGVMLCSDQCGPVVLEACRRAGVQVPEDVAVIGVDDDEPLCDVAGPGLSSVWPDHTRVGYEAAALLDRMMRRQDPPATAVRIPPRGVVTRRSTDVLAVGDRTVAAAVRLIRERACDANGLSVDQVAAEVSVSRSVLQRRFREVVGRTLHDEMLRVRLSKARALLAETDLPIAAVAQRAGFRHREYMGAVFRQKVGTTPAEYRRISSIRR